MADGNKAASSYHKLSSFLQSTWFEIPDQASASRIMRPQFSERVRAIPTGRKQDEGTLLKQEGEPGKGDSHDETREGLKGISSQEDSGKKTSKPEAAKKAEEESDDYIASSAVYMPFLSFSTEFQAVKNSTTKSANQPVNQPANPSPELPTDQSDYESISNPDDQPTRRARFAKDKVERFSRAGTISSKLMESYENSVIHGSATLDESYYHFSQGDKAQKDRLRRNGSQVVTKQLESSCEDTEQDQQCEGEQVACWPLLRVNQVWIWTIDEKWLISATSHPVDDVEQLWIDGFIEYLDKQARVGGAQSQPESTKDMMKTIVDYCIGSYERKRTFDDFAPRIRDSNGDREANWKDGPSIRQLFSDYINYIGRKETSLFDEFRVQIQNTVTSMERDKRYEESILKAVSLFSEIKDIRDELNILKSTANYQNAVQQKLFGQSSANSKSSTLAANYIVNDIIEMDRLASRVQSAVDATLTLQHSEIANFQARKATEQGEEARTQGKSLMVFTGATILFLPMSFFTSLFALDVKSFQEAPSWVFGVIFGVSMAFSIVCVLCAVNSESISEFMKPYLDRISEFMKRYLDRISKFMKPYLHRISEFMKPYLHRISELSAKAAKSTVKGGTTFITKGREFLGKISTFAPRNNGAPQPPDHSTVGQDGQNATGEGSQYQGEASFGSSSRQRLTLTRHSDVEAGLTEGTGSSGT
ncbi:hypothetical protein GGR54DRAFT_340844 [Hypoxylon sp. NC1633]|nr:hypothetical protein GGR54DRAFT_340844 [Hypoxylon sp. NC1633]